MRKISAEFVLKYGYRMPRKPNFGADSLHLQAAQAATNGVLVAVTGFDQNQAYVGITDDDLTTLTANRDVTFYAVAADDFANQ